MQIEVIVCLYNGLVLHDGLDKQNILTIKRQIHNSTINPEKCIFKSRMRSEFIIGQLGNH